MDLRRLRAGEWVAALSGAALLTSLFLPWYRGTTAWEAFSALDAVFALGGACGVALLLVTATQRTVALPIALDAMVAMIGIALVALVLLRVIDVPDGAAARAPALYLGLAGAMGVAVGGCLAMRDERLSPPGSTTDATGRPVPPPPEIETLPAPRPSEPAR